jgi:uncharacterized protein YkwD
MLGLNIVDILIILALLLYVATHVHEGFIVLSRRLLAFFGAIVMAFSLYASAGAVVSNYVSWPPGIIDALSFLTLFLIFQIVLSYLLALIFSIFPYEVQRSTASKVLAVVPASIDALVLISLTLLLLVIIPILPQVKPPIENSQIGSTLVNKVAGIEGYVDRVFGRATQETLGFLTIRPGVDDVISLPFKAERLSLDESSERRMLVLLNQERARVGAPALTIDPTIIPVAREHSEDMWKRSYFAHENPDGESPFDRMTRGGVDFRAAGENLALARTVERAHIGLMNSPGHRRNILDPSFTRIGIGVIDGGIYGKMFTQNFAD